MVWNIKMESSNTLESPTPVYPNAGQDQPSRQNGRAVTTMGQSWGKPIGHHMTDDKVLKRNDTGTTAPVRSWKETTPVTLCLCHQASITQQQEQTNSQA
jgi:hypothetical protein